MNKKLALSLGVLALFAACSDDKDMVDDVATGGNGGANHGGASSKGGTGGKAAGGAAGDANVGHGGVTPQGGMAGEGGISTTGGAAPAEGGSAGVGEPGGASGAGAGGVSTGGATGTGGVNGTGGSAPVVSTDKCTEAETAPNEDRTTATAYTLGTAYTACLQSVSDVDVYAFQVPADSRGGYVQVSITDVGTAGDVAMSVYSSADNGQFHNVGTNSDGASIYMYFNAKAGAKFYIPVTKYLDVRSPNPYTFKATYTQVPDLHEPNDLRSAATPISVGTAASGYLFAGWEYSTGIPDEEWQDYYAVELAAGDANILLSIMASDNNGKITLYDSLGTQVAVQGSNTEGASVVLKHTVTTGGIYYVKIEPYLPPKTKDNTATVPQYLKLPYTLTVTQ